MLQHTLNVDTRLTSEWRLRNFAPNRKQQRAVWREPVLCDGDGVTNTVISDMFYWPWPCRKSWSVSCSAHAVFEVKIKVCLNTVYVQCLMPSWVTNDGWMEFFLFNYKKVFSRQNKNQNKIYESPVMKLIKIYVVNPNFMNKWTCKPWLPCLL